MADIFNIVGLVLGFVAAVLFLDEVIPQLFRGVRWDTDRLGNEAFRYYPAEQGAGFQTIAIGMRPVRRPVRFQDIATEPRRAKLYGFILRHDNTRKARGLDYIDVRTRNGDGVDAALFTDSFRAIQAATEEMGRDLDASQIRAIGICLLVASFFFQFVGAVVNAAS